ncbi:MAG: Gfo/Idh/MocA family oxidoreductase [Desulfobacteraceae bacterium]|nr:Gfo/Idh/MocA family oxidoreductase [Desulfobacteraceae bacterium]MBC2718115.1 Gfo/Idh/MocA family oxidoreductase [Desulfobacteraceae bacterium]
MKKIINIGVIGCANIADRYIIPSILELKELFNLVGVASRNTDKAKYFAEKFDVLPYTGYEALLEEKDLDAVYIPLPNSLHAEWIEKAFNENLHVLVEKSLACNLQDVERLNQIALDKDLALVENFQFRFHNQLAFIQQLVAKGKIGKLRCLRSSFGFPPFPDKENIRYKKDLGGGALLDAGAYPVKISQIFMGYDLTVAASSLYIDKKLDVDIFGGGYLKQQSGDLFAEIAFGFDNFYQCNLELWGSKGKISTKRIFTAPLGYKPEVVIDTESGRKTISLEADNHFQNMLKHFHSLIITKSWLEEECMQNMHQARLLKELKEKANGK